MLDETNELPIIIDIILIPDFSLMAFTSAIEPLRSANRLSGKKLYDWRVVSVDGSSVISSNGVEIVPSGAQDIIQKPKLIFVVSGYGVQFYNNNKLIKNILSNNFSNVQLFDIVKLFDSTSSVKSIKSSKFVENGVSFRGLDV